MKSLSFSSLVHSNLYFLWTFLFKSTLSLHFSIENSTYLLKSQLFLCFSIETSTFSLLFSEISTSLHFSFEISTFFLLFHWNLYFHLHSHRCYSAICTSLSATPTSAATCYPKPPWCIARRFAPPWVQFPLVQRRKAIANCNCIPQRSAIIGNPAPPYKASDALQLHFLKPTPPPSATQHSHQTTITRRLAICNCISQWRTGPTIGDHRRPWASIGEHNRNRRCTPLPSRPPTAVSIVKHNISRIILLSAASFLLWNKAFRAQLPLSSLNSLLSDMTSLWPHF